MNTVKKSKALIVHEYESLNTIFKENTTRAAQEIRHLAAGREQYDY